MLLFVAGGGDGNNVINTIVDTKIIVMIKNGNGGDSGSNYGKRRCSSTTNCFGRCQNCSHIHFDCVVNVLIVVVRAQLIGATAAATAAAAAAHGRTHDFALLQVKHEPPRFSPTTKL